MGLSNIKGRLYKYSEFGLLPKWKSKKDTVKDLKKSFYREE